MKNGVMRRQEPETIRKRETILFIIKMQKKRGSRGSKNSCKFCIKIFFITIHFHSVLENYELIYL